MAKPDPAPERGGRAERCAPVRSRRDMPAHRGAVLTKGALTGGGSQRGRLIGASFHPVTLGSKAA